MGYALMIERTNLKKYLNGSVLDNKETRQKAGLDMSKIWSSIGVPYAVNGKQYNKSYYSGDKATVDTELVQTQLQELRKNLIGATEEKKNFENGINYRYLLLSLSLVVGGYFVYKNRKLLKI